MAEVGMDKSNYKMRDELHSLRVYDYNTWSGRWSREYHSLCPLNGLDNIQLIAETYDKDGNSIPATILPLFSLRRGYTTILCGPLFSGTTSDWSVTMEPYASN